MLLLKEPFIQNQTAEKQIFRPESLFLFYTKQIIHSILIISPNFSRMEERPFMAIQKRSWPKRS
ncbi:hypothetical protein SD78_3389 [Bacillus badius]|nr:hypothetical protein SD78_3389 [Bacillus badius]